MLKVTTRYLASHFIPPFILGFVFFVAFLITFYMFRIISLIVNKGVDLATVVGMVLNLSASFFPLATPLAAFFATIYTLNKLSEDSEIIAMRSFGISKFRIYWPFFIVSLFIGLTIFSLNSVYIPRANANFKNTILKLTSAGMLTSIKSGQFFTDIPSVTLFAEGVSEGGDNFREVFLHILNRETMEQKIIFAKNGSLIKLYANESYAPSLRMNLTDGNIVKIASSGEQIDKVLFKQYDFPIFNANFAQAMLDKDTMKTTAELHTLIETREQKWRETEKTPAQTPIQVNERKEAKKMIVKSQIEYFGRFLIVPQILFFVLLGFSLGIKKGRGASGNNSIRAVIVLLGYYGLYFFLISLAQREVVSAALACLVPVVLLFSIALFYFRKLDWVG